ncbi:MAG: hypothetical protein LBF70_00750, partial [Holosporales bacterium]|nr:hypothetical protein [Holosporales bacterium]
MANGFVIKRDGTFAPFNLDRITQAIFKAAGSTEEFDIQEAERLAHEVFETLTDKYQRSPPTIEDIQDIVENTLIKNNHLPTAKAYILYREKHAQLRAEQKSLVNAVATVDEYIEELDWRVKANANLGYSLGGLILNLSGKVVANYWLNRIYTSKVTEA